MMTYLSISDLLIAHNNIEIYMIHPICIFLKKKHFVRTNFYFENKNNLLKFCKI